MTASRKVDSSMSNALPTPQPPTPQSPAAGGWARFREVHLFDYSRTATRCWLAIAAAGLSAGTWAAWALARHPPQDVWTLLAGLTLVALAACFPVKLPRSTHSVVVADVFIFTLLVTVGAPAAVLAAGVEALVGALRTSKRLTSRISSPTSAMVAMASCGAAYAAVRSGCIALGLSSEGATLLALCAAAPLPVAVSTAALMWLAAIKRGQRLGLAAWFEASTWFVAVTLVAAFVAGLVHLNVQRYGQVVNGVAVALVFGLIWLLRVTVRREEAERQAQEAQTAAARRDAELSQQRFVATFTHAAIGMAVVKPSDDGAAGQPGAVRPAVAHRSATSWARRFATSCSRAMLHCSADGCKPLPPARKRRSRWNCAAARAEASTSGWWCIAAATKTRVAKATVSSTSCTTSRRDTRPRTGCSTSPITTDSPIWPTGYCFNERLNVAVEHSRIDASRRFRRAVPGSGPLQGGQRQPGARGRQQLAARSRRTAWSAACVRATWWRAWAATNSRFCWRPCRTPRMGLRLSQRVLDSLTKPVSINGTQVVAGASIGITFSDLGYRTAEEVLRDADLAMYEAKAGGRGRVALFDSSMHERVAQKLALEADLRKAIGDGQMSVHFQPLYELEPYRLCGFEALARWVHPERGAISPDVFIALAEESGHIEALTRLGHRPRDVQACGLATRARWRRPPQRQREHFRSRPGAR